METSQDDSVFDNELTVSNYCLVRSRHVGVLLYISDDLSYNVTFTGSENLGMLGITLHNGNNNWFCLFISPPVTTHLVLQQLFILLFSKNLSPPLYSTFVLIGDFIVNVLDTNSSLYHCLHDTLSSFNLL